MSERSAWILLVAAMLLLAGCTNTDSPATESPTVDTPTVGEPITQTIHPTAADRTTTPERTPEPTTDTPEPVDNPWGREPVVIGVGGSPDRDHEPQIRRAVDYWQGHGEGHVRWAPAFSVRPNATNPDVEIRFVASIKRCGFGITGSTIGCARQLSADSRPADPEIVRINAGLTNESTYRTIRHELGHLLGLGHGSGPDDVMAPYDEVYNSVYRVAITYDTTASTKQRISRRQVRYALDYYAEGADGHINESVEFAIIEKRADADIVVAFTDTQERDGSIGRYDSGVYSIEVDGVTLRKRGWHVGYWLGFIFGADSTRELPPPFDEPDSDRRQNWW